MIFICYPKCSTCKKARAWLDENGIEYTVRDIVQDKPNESELRTWHQLSGLPLKRFFNTSGKKYRESNLKDQLSAMSVEEQYVILSTDGMLVKRPLLVGEGFVLTGFREQEWKEKILG